MFIALSGVSASGKNTVIKELTNRCANIKVLESSSCTTRAPRESDGQFNTYVYMSEEEFKDGIDKGMFFEYENVHGHYYGTILSKLELASNDKDNYYVRDIDVKGTINLKKFFKEGEFISIFIDAPNEVLRERLKLRGDKEEDIEKRLSRGELERSYKKYYDLVIDNIDLEKTVNTIIEYIQNHKKV